MLSRPAVLITGAAMRLGAAMARSFADAGWHVIIHYRDSSLEADRLIEELEGAETIGCDLADADTVRAMVDGLADRLEDWRVIVNNASLFEFDDARRVDLAIFERAMAVNALGATVLAQAFLARARSRTERRVINVLDQKIENMNPDFFSYTMSKAALAAATRMLAMGHVKDRIYGLAPGAILASHDQAPQEAELSHRLNLLERRTTTGEIASAALHLAEGHLASGQTVFVDSGQHLMRQRRDVLFLAREGQ